MLVVENNKTMVNWNKAAPVNPLHYGGDLVVVFDPSKTNMAMLIGTPSGEIIKILEFSGNNRRKGPVMNTTLYCEEVRCFIRKLFEGASLKLVATEQAISKKGMEYYKSQMVLTEIRGNIHNFFMEAYEMAVVEINNWSWKNGILPQGYRGMSQKGSKKYFQEHMASSGFADYFEADATDVICMFMYIVSQKYSNYVVYCNASEPPMVEYTYGIYPDNDITKNIPTVSYNDRFTLEENISFYVNRMFKPFAFQVPVSALSMDDIYKKTVMFDIKDIWCKQVKVVASRK